MASKRRDSVAKRSMLVAVRAAGSQVRRAKLHATGESFRRLHRVESMLVTVEGRKPPVRTKKKKASRKKKKS